jgi:outer membrane protein
MGTFVITSNITIGRSLMKTKIAVLVCMLSVFCFSVTSNAQGDQLTLEQTVLAGLKANPSVESARQVVEQAQMNVKAARGSFMPSFTVQSSYSKYALYGDVLTPDNLDRNIFTNQLAISQPLFAGYSILNNYLKAKIQVDADNARLDQARLDLIFHIQQDFLQLLKSREDLKTVNNEIKRVESQMEASNVFYKAGLAPYNDVLKSEVELSKAQTDKIKIMNIIKNLLTQLNTYRSAPFDEDVEYVGDLQDFSFTVNYDENSAITAALSKRPDLLIGKKSIALAEKDAKDTFSRYYPRITLDYTIGRQKSEYENYVLSKTTQDTDTVGVNLRWNIFDGGTTTYSYRANLKHIAALKGSLENQIAEAKATIVKAFTNIEDARKLIELSLSTKKSALENYNMAAARYRTRIGTINDMFDAQSSLTRSESDISNAYMQYHVAKAALFYNIGVENIGLSWVD